MIDGDVENRAHRNLRGERRTRRLDSQFHRPAQELQAPVLLERTREQACFGEHLEAVADADHHAARRRVVGDRRHHRAEAGDGARSQVVAVGEPAGQHDHVDAVQRPVAVPHQLGRAAKALDRCDYVVLTVGAREQHHADATSQR